MAAPERPERSVSLAHLEHNKCAAVSAVLLGAAEADWLRAVGMFEGQRVTVVRRGIFGGPLHVRTGSGGEFAIDARLAESIHVERLPAGADR